MITREHALALVDKHLGSGLRARHSIFVGCLMKHLANTLDENAELWEIAGICHDLDFDVTTDDRSRHGMVAAEWLKDDLPAVALAAIRSHDHRTGVVSDTKLADALKLSDAIAIGEITAGRPAMVLALAQPDDGEAMRSALADRPYLPDMILKYSQKHEISLAAMADVCNAAPQQ
jgi:predicted hydrolase (HD superfamily)